MSKVGKYSTAKFYSKVTVALLLTATLMFVFFLFLGLQSFSGVLSAIIRGMR